MTCEAKITAFKDQFKKKIDAYEKDVADYVKLNAAQESLLAEYKLKIEAQEKQMISLRARRTKYEKAVAAADVDSADIEKKIASAKAVMDEIKGREQALVSTKESFCAYDYLGIFCTPQP